MEPRARARLAGFEQLLHQIDAPARAVELVPEQLISWAGRGAKPAMHAGAEDRLRFASFSAVADEFGEMRFQS